MAKPRKPKPDDGSSVVAPSVRVFTDYNPAKIRSAITSAESGNLTQAVQVCEWLLTDDKIDGALDSRCDELLGLVPTFEASGDRRRSNRAVKALEGGEDFWAAYPEHELRLMLRWGLLLGCSLHRHRWPAREDHGGRVLPFPEFFHPQSLRQDIRTRAWFVRTAAGDEIQVEPGGSEWILHTPFGAQRPWAGGKWRSCSRWVLLKHYAILDWARHGEKAALLVATSDADSTQKQRAELAQDLQASGSDRIVALAAGFDLKMVEVTANTRQIYEAQIEAADKAISILLRGGNLTSDVSKNGARAAAETQAKHGEEPKLRFDAEALSTTLHDQSLTWWAEFNYGDSKLAPWPVWPVEPEEDLKASADTINVLGDGLTKLEALGFELDDKGLVERFRLEDVVTGRKPPEQRAKEAAERAAAAQPAVEPGKDPKDPKAPKPKQAAGGFRAELEARLASGASLADNAGFGAGQLYADAAAESGAAAALEALEPTLQDIAAALEASTSYDDLRARLRTLYADSKTDTELAELVYRCMLLGEMAGRRSVVQDA